MCTFVGKRNIEPERLRSIATRRNKTIRYLKTSVYQYHDTPLQITPHSQSFTPISVPSLQAQSSLLPHTATESCFPYPIQQYSALPVPLSLLHTLVPLFRCNTDLQYRLEIKLSITGVYFSHKNTLFKKPKLTLCSTVQVPTAKTSSAPLQPPEQGEHRTTWSRLKIPCWRLMASKMKTGVFSKEYEV